MTKRIIIIGGGISGLSLLHYLNMMYRNRDDIEIQLLEKEERPGGTIASLRQKGCLFETGPNGFLDSQPDTLALVEDLKLTERLQPASEEAKQRFLCVDDKLYPMPESPQSLFGFPLMSLREKLGLAREWFVRPGQDPKETVFEFGQRRLSRKFSELFLDPMVSGVFGGDASKLNLKTAFPRIYEIEQAYGSLLKGMMKLAAARKKIEKSGESYSAAPRGRLTSFDGGMETLTAALYQRYRDSIILSQPVESVTRNEGLYLVTAKRTTYQANEVFVCTPAYVAGKLLYELSPSIGEQLSAIEYAPMVVIGLVYEKNAFAKLPAGFGYLVPSTENKEVLGILFSSNIFTGRGPEGQILLRVMIGGARHPYIFHKTKQELVKIARDEIHRVLKAEKEPVHVFDAIWAKAIPQYTNEYVEMTQIIMDELAEFKRLHLVANYLGGISLNDCVRNAKKAAQRGEVI